MKNVQILLLLASSIFIKISTAIFCDYTLDPSTSDYICEFSNTFSFHDPLSINGTHLNETFTQNDVTVVRSNVFDQDTIYEELTNIITVEFANLKILKLNHVEMMKISPTAFSNCAKLTEIDLSDNSLNNLPEFVFKNCDSLTTLKMARNNFTEFGLNVFDGLQNLKFLSFIGNKLTKIDGNLLKSLTSLTEINFSNNLITSIDADAFDGLTALTKIDFSNNQLTNIILTRNYGKIFDFSNNNLKVFSIDADIEELNLASNELLSIPKINFEFLKVLKFSGNYIGLIDEYTLKYARKLEILDLSTCGIYAIFQNAFFTLDSLHSLNLQHNNLQNVNNIFQANLQNLEILDLSSNSLKLSEYLAFFHLKSLKTLKLSHNRIEKLWFLKHAKYENLEFLDLNGNSFTTLEKFSSLSNFSKLIEIDFSYNPIQKIEEGFFDSFSNATLKTDGIDCIRNAVGFEKCYENFELWKTITTEEPEVSTISPEKELVMTIISIIAAAVMLLGLIWYIHKVLMAKEIKKNVKHETFEKNDMNYQRF